VKERLDQIEQKLWELGAGLTLFLVESMELSESCLVAANSLVEAQQLCVVRTGKPDFARADVTYLGNAGARYKVPTVIRYFYNIGETL